MAGRYGPPTPPSIRRANMAKEHHQRSGLLGGIQGALGGIGKAVARPMFNALAQAQGGRPPSSGFQTPLTSVGSSPLVRGAGQASRFAVQKPVQFYVGPQAASMLVGRPANPYAASLEAALAMVPGAGSKMGIKAGITPLMRDPRVLAAARYAPRFNNMRGGRTR